MEFSEKIHRARNGDREAVDQLLVDWRPWLRNKARGLLGAGQAARVDSSDVVQVTLAEAFQNMKQFRGRSQSEWAVWLQRILRGQAVRLRRYHAAEMRRAGREVAGSWSVADGGLTPTSLVLKQERLTELQTALRALPEPLQEIVQRRIFQEQSFGAIASRLGLSPRTVRRHWIEALRRLARSLHSTAHPHPDCRA